MANIDAVPHSPENIRERFVRAFEEVRGELVRTLFYVLGNQEDAQDSSQETFLKCWRAHESLGTVQNMRAWIFKVGMNAAKDLRRNAWRKRSRPMTFDV